MAIITFQCSNCQKVMRIGADKAGKRAKCSKCGHNLVIPNQSQDLNGPQPKPKHSIFGDDEEGHYGFKEEAEPAQADKKSDKASFADLYKSDEDNDDAKDEAEEKKEEAERDAQRLLSQRRKDAMLRLRKAPIDVAVWEKTRLGILLVMVGIGFWMGAVVLQRLVFLNGIPYSAEYAETAATELIDRQEPPEPGKLPTFYRARFIIGLVGGRDMIDVNLWLYRVSYLFVLIQLVCTGTGYALCMAAPARYGAKALATALLPIVGFSFIITLTLKLLPVAGAYNYTMIPLIAPESAILRSNIEREVPIHLFWSNAPFTESLLAILLHLASFGELVLFCIFLRSVALNLKDEKLKDALEPLLRLALSIGFIVTAFHLLINTGTSEVLINMLWVVYLFTFGFYIWFLIWYMMAMVFAQTRILKAIRMYGGDEAAEDDEDDENEEDDEDEDEDEEDEE